MKWKMTEWRAHGRQRQDTFIHVINIIDRNMTCAEDGQMWATFSTNLELKHVIKAVYWSRTYSNSKRRSVFDGDFYRASICEGGLGSRNSVCPFVRLSVTRVDCDNWRTTYIFTPHERAITLLLCYQQWLVGDAPSLWNLRSKWPTLFEIRRLRPISAHNVSTVGGSEKRSITTNIKSTTVFPTSHRWSAYVTPKCPKEWPKGRFFVFWVKVNGWSSQTLST